VTAPNRLTGLQPSDRLYRILRPESWDRASLLVHDLAFRDKYTKLSLFVAGLATPYRCLEFFCRFPLAKRLGNGQPATPRLVYDHGIGIGVLNASVILDLGLRLDPLSDGTVIRSDGHIDVIDGQEYAVELAAATRALSEAEIFGPGIGSLPADGAGLEGRV
jgi:hypothetical protein